MKTIIAGSRDITDFNLVQRAIQESGFDITEVVSGTARGVDKLGELWAMQNNIPIKRFPADWTIGKHAGFLRNADMSEYGEALIAITTGSKGTASMIKLAQTKSLRVFVLYV